MSQQREFNAPTIEEALEKAAEALNTKPAGISYETLDSGSSGFLGLGARDARILVELPESGDDVAPETPDSTDDADKEEDSAEAGGAEPGMPAERSDDSEPETIPEDIQETIRSHVEAMLDAMAFESEVSIRDEDEVIAVDIESEDAGLLIGQKGETIYALQYLVNASIHKDHSISKRVVLDCEGYRERRIKAVQGMAHRTARRVSREKRAIELPHMSSSERRAVHSYLKDNPNVTTASSGNDETRRVTISPT